MEDFIVKRENSKGGKWYMYIGFQDMRTDCEPMVNCFGSVLISPDDESEYWFNYSFHHSLDWHEFSGMILRPIKKYPLTRQQVREIGSDIVYNIKEFISKMN
jgi:hypothetical protein